MPKLTQEQMDLVLLKMGDPSVPPNHRSSMLIDILAGAQAGNPNETVVAKEIFKRLENAAGDELAKERAEQLAAILKMLESAPMKPATFVETSKMEGSVFPHAMVALDNGDFGYVVIHDDTMVKKLKLGDRVVVDGKGVMLMLAAPNEFRYGPEARYERRIDDRHIEVITHQDERMVVLANHKLMEGIQSGQTAPGASIILCTGGQVGLCALPPADEEFSHFQFLDRAGIPNIVVDRDIGSPSKLIARVALHIREEMTRPELRRRFKLRPCVSSLLEGVSGTGKTLTVQAIHRQMYEIMAEVTGTPLEQLPPRVFRFKPSKALSMWLGQSDKNVDRFFDEVEQLAGKEHVNAKGEKFRLPVLVVMEEADGMGRARGEEAIYDRIMTTILQRLDPNREGLGDKLVVFLSTTNEPHIIDPAFLRRIGGTVETFGRLDRRGFSEVFRKHIEGIPASNGHGKSQKSAWNQILKRLDYELYSEAADPGVVELAVSGIPHPVIKHRRDFITGALIDRAVQDAATKAWELAIGGDEASGLNADQLLTSLDRQVLSVVKQLTPQNVGHYIDLPEGVRVTGIKKVVKA